MDTQRTVYGEFPAHFRVETLRNLCAGKDGIQTGPFGSQLHQRDYVPVGTPIITVEHLGENHILHQNLPRVSDSDRSRLAKYRLQEGDIVFSRVGSVDRRALVSGAEEGWLFSGRCLRVRPDPSEVDSQYLSYFFALEVFREYIRSIAVGATMPSLNTQILSDIPIVLPDISEQQAIAHVLGTLDDKIELNRRMNRTLEEMARTIFQDWFVDFGPTRAKIEGQEPYLPPELWDLFPEQLVDSELGEIPEGWEVKPLSECIMIDKGLSYKGAGLSPTGMPMHNLNSVHEGGGYKDNGIKFYNGDFRNRHITRPGDVLVTNTEQGHDRLLIGFAAIVPSRFGKEGIFSHHIYRVQPKNYTGLTSDFICHLLNTKAMHETISGYATGTTVNMLPTDALVIPEIIVPSRSAVEIFSGFSQHARGRQEKFIEECQQLTELRDNLLPRLVSGEVPVELADSPSEL